MTNLSRESGVAFVFPVAPNLKALVKEAPEFLPYPKKFFSRAVHQAAPRLQGEKQSTLSLPGKARFP